MKAVSEMTLQEAVDYSVQQIVKQGKRCMTGSSCAYGEIDGSHCAVGWLLDPEDEDLMDHAGDVEDLVIDHYANLPTVITANVDVFSVLQSVHDAREPSKIGSNISRLKKYGIDVSGIWFTQWDDLRAAQVIGE